MLAWYQTESLSPFSASYLLYFFCLLHLLILMDWYMYCMERGVFLQERRHLFELRFLDTFEWDFLV